MNLNHYLGLGVVFLLGTSSLANAESYVGVLSIDSERPRAALNVEARVAARRPITGEATFIESAASTVGSLSRAEVRRGAEETAKESKPYADHAGSGVLNVRSTTGANEKARANRHHTFSSRDNQG